MEPDCICANAIMCRTKKLMYLYHCNCDVQANMSVAIARIVTDKEKRVLLSQKLWRTKVAISTSVTDWLLLSLLLGQKIMYECCYRYTVTDTSRRLRDGQLTEAFYCSTYFFRNLLSTFCDFLFATLRKKRHRNAAIAAFLNAPLWQWCNDSTDVCHKFDVVNLSWLKLRFNAKALFIKVHRKTARTFWVGNTKLNIILISFTSQIRHKMVAIVTLLLSLHSKITFYS